ncbi:MAG TPA: amidohydrolase family protein [bacterium]|uniref:Amidohydrolase n=1 Tax=candidate division TA06 bacterium ADurb.Bin417 TaxID=1852828 RepID=A0A1V5MFR2_UNCT6|nr:MAG: Amidohydrolase [candidate division TA06 bacterium ADurb.Bin417]HNQ35648.1 amidohydrolase family protein [bacterium]HNS48327.1 amidohydrolase family protein [bacterium]
MKLDWFDFNLYLGRPFRPVFGAVPDAAALQAELRRRGIGRALVWHIAQHDNFPGTGNRLLADELKGKNNLFGCWVVLPPQTGEIIGPDFFPAMRRRRIRALRLFPESHHFLLNRTVFGRFFDEVSERKIPVLLSTMKRGKGVGWPDIYSFLAEYPKLTCVLCDIGIWGVNRYTWPLLERYPKLYLETSCLALEAGGLDAGLARFGPERFLFGSGFPERYPEASQLPLVHAAVSESGRRLVAAGNAEKLLAEVEL